MTTRVLVVFYTMTGRTASLAKAIASGAEDQSASVRLRQVREHLSETALADRPKVLKVKELLREVPMASHEDVLWADGIAFGAPTRYGTMPNQIKAFVESLGEIGTHARFNEKIASVFTSTTEHFGGPGCTIPMLIPLFYMGFILLGCEHTADRRTLELFRDSPFTEPVPPSPEDEEGPTQQDLEIARVLGRRLAYAAARLKIRAALHEAA